MRILPAFAGVLASCLAACFSPARAQTCAITGPTMVVGSIGVGDPTQTGRMTRNAFASTCEGKAYPGSNDALTGRRFDQYTFTNPSASSQCVYVTLNSACGTSLFSAAYLGSFNPGDIAANFLGDAGAS